MLEINGEIVQRCDPHIGLLHRGTEKLSEYKTWLKFYRILIDRSCFNDGPRICFFFNHWKIHKRSYGLWKFSFEVPKRAQYIRVIFLEITRILNHILALTTHAMDVVL